MPMRFVYKIQHATVRMFVMVLGSILAWGIMAVIMRFSIVGLDKIGVPVHYPALVAFTIQVFVAMFVTVFGDRYSAKGEGKVKWKLYVFAGVLGLITGVALVFLSDADDTSGGLLMSFPIILIASLSSLASAYAETLPITATTAMIGGSVSTSLYAILFAESLPMFDKLFQKDPGHPPTFKPVSVAVTTIVCWFSCLLVISLPVLFILRCLARREKGAIEKIRWNSDFDAAAPGTHNGLTADWDNTFGSDDEDDGDGLTSADSLRRSTSGRSSSLYPHSTSTSERASLLGNDSLMSRPSVYNESDTAARRAILEESVNDESPLFIGGLSGVALPESPVPPGSSRLSPISSSYNRR
jgi:hypothetical protein